MTKKFIGGLITGMVLGAVASIIFMPESGRKVADKVRSKAKDMAEKLREKREEAAELAMKTEEFFEHLVDEGSLTQEQADDVSRLLKKYTKNKITRGEI